MVIGLYIASSDEVVVIDDNVVILMVRVAEQFEMEMGIDTKKIGQVPRMRDLESACAFVVRTCVEDCRKVRRRRKPNQLWQAALRKACGVSSDWPHETNNAFINPKYVLV